MAATLRRTFRYPDDDDDRNLDHRPELDEEEQDKIIQELSTKNDAQNTFYHFVFTIVPLIGILAYIPAIFSSSVTAGTTFIYMICILSLSTTAYLMKTNSHSKLSRPAGPSVLAVQEQKSDSRIHLLCGNALLCALLSLQSWYLSGSQGHDDSQRLMLGILPAVVLGIVVIASRLLIEVDIGELEKLRYNYKGA